MRVSGFCCSDHSFGAQWLIVCFLVGFFLFALKATVCFISHLILLFYRYVPSSNDSDYCYVNVWQWGVVDCGCIWVCNGGLFAFWSAFLGSKTHRLFSGHPNFAFLQETVYWKQFGLPVSQCVSVASCCSDHLLLCNG